MTQPPGDPDRLVDGLSGLVRSFCTSILPAVTQPPVAEAANRLMSRAVTGSTGETPDAALTAGLS